ncbi:NmrA family NAD(P)-binding protein [Nocardia sp. NPDC005825]|uniref:NmrA family NAD(P)-binding protein n=1 Tax=unclassified Nocardia TaxID=2637762 RepID=UPI0033F7CD98
MVWRHASVGEQGGDALISTRAIGAFAAIAFDRPEEFLGRTVPLAGDHLTPPQIAEIIGAHAGLPLHSRVVPLEQVRAFDPHVGQIFTHFNESPDGPLDLAELRAEHPGLLDLAAWLRCVDWRP